MTHLASLLGTLEINNLGLWMFLSISTVAMFVIFIPTVTFLDNRRKEREAYYKAETFRRLAESSGEGAKAAIELLREEDRLRRIKAREGLKIGGVINVAVGLALLIFLRMMMGSGPGSPALVGLIPGFIGVAMLVYVFFLASPIE
ncbi:MAG: hypothetical protein ABSE87_06070 [Terracidiphilus sp.]